MALELLKDIVKIPSKGIYLHKDSTQEQLVSALKHEPKLSVFIKDNKKQAKQIENDASK